MFDVIGFTEHGTIRVSIDGVISEVPDDMENSYRFQIWNEWEMGAPDHTGFRMRINTIPPYVPPSEPENPPYTLYKSTFVRRMVSDETTDEAEILENVLANAPAKLRMLYNSVEYFVSNDELFTQLHAAIAAALTSQRANELLAPEQE